VHATQLIIMPSLTLCFTPKCNAGCETGVKKRHPAATPEITSLATADESRESISRNCYLANLNYYVFTALLFYQLHEPVVTVQPL